MRCLLIAPNFFDYHEKISDAFVMNGIEVTSLSQIFPDNKLSKILYRYLPSIAAWLYVWFIAWKTMRLSSVGYVVVIKGEGLNLLCVRYLRKKFPDARFIFYNWDSRRNHEISDFIFTHFDAVKSFDYRDCQNDKRLIHLPLFYSDRGSDCEKRSKVLFVGTLHSQRYERLKSLVEGLNEDDLAALYFYYPSRLLFYLSKLVSPEFRNVKTSEVSFVPMSRSHLEDLSRQTLCIVDICHEKQTGLTMRSLEALGAGSKLATNNEAITKYRFYHPDNVYIIDRDSRSFHDFLECESSGAPSSELDLLHLPNWISLLLDIDQTKTAFLRPESDSDR